MSELLKNIFRFVLFIFVQVFILFKMPPLHRFITPYLYYLYILWLPFSMSRASLMAAGFYIRPHVWIISCIHPDYTPPPVY